MSASSKALSPRSYLHYDPERVDYAVSGEELEQLCQARQNLWKDVCLVLLPLGIACLLNAVADTQIPLKLDLALFLNYLFGVLGLILGLVFGVAWRRSDQDFRSLVAGIREKPKVELASAEDFTALSLFDAQSTQSE